MYKIDRKFIRTLTQDLGNATSKKICVRVENYEQNSSISSKEAKRLKQELKDIVHESFRDLETSIKFYNEGRQFTKYKVYNNPTDNK